jgi:hypothetical protein
MTPFSDEGTVHFTARVVRPDARCLFSVIVEFVRPVLFADLAFDASYSGAEVPS